MRTSLFLTLLLSGLIFISQAEAEESVEFKTGTRIIISTSGPAKFKSYWLNHPCRLVVEFQSRNIVSKIDKEIIVNQGIIKKISSSYFKKGQTGSLRLLTFELPEKVPHRIWQEDNTILLDIQAPLETNGFSIGTKIKQDFVETESGQAIKRLEAMDTALKQTQGTQTSTELLVSQLTHDTLKTTSSAQKEQGKIISTAPPEVKKNTMGVMLWFLGLASVSGLWVLVWRKYAVVKTKNMAQEIRELNLQLEEKDKLLEQIEIIRKTIEKTAVEKEKEYKQLKLELQEKNMLFAQEEAMRKEKEKTLLELEKQHEQLRKTSESLEDVLIKRGIAKELTSPEGKKELWILGKSQDRRNSPRLILTKDFHNTVILKIKLPDTLAHIKSFAENINSGGLCFETSKELDDKYPLILRLFFYGGKVPNFKTQGWIVWKKTQDSKNYYGVTFEGLSEKIKSELEHYVESNLPPTYA